MFSGPKKNVKVEKADPVEEYYKRELQRLKMFAGSYTMGSPKAGDDGETVQKPFSIHKLRKAPPMDKKQDDVQDMREIMKHI